MNQNNRQDFSLNNKKRLKEKINGSYQSRQWLRLSHWNRFAYLTLTACILTFILTLFSPAWLSTGKSVAYSPVTNGINERLILAQEETEEPREENQERKEQIEESTTEEEAESAEEEVESREEEVESREEEAESAEEKAESAEEEVESREEEVESREEEVESREEEAESEGEFSFEEAKESLEEEIDERYEEWESKKTISQISHSISAFATILMTVIITLFGTDLFEIPYKKLIIVVLGVITVLIQLNVNVFLLEKSLAGYEILADQGLTLKGKLEYVRTDEELKEVREQFQELILESIAIE